MSVGDKTDKKIRKTDGNYYGKVSNKHSNWLFI